VGASQDEYRLFLVKQGGDSLACLGEKGLATEKRAKLFWSRIAGYATRECLQPHAVSACQHNGPSVLLVCI
jgi:hypothetical protein